MTETPDPHPLDGQMEPAAEMFAKAHPSLPSSHSATVSIAISLKRIADAMTGPTNEWGETMAEAVGGNIRRAMQDVTSMVRQELNARR